MTGIAQCRSYQNSAYTSCSLLDRTFLKRKGGLFKKAHELSVLCSVDVAVIIFGSNKKLYEYSSCDISEVLQRYNYVSTSAYNTASPTHTSRNSMDSQMNTKVPPILMVRRTTTTTTMTRSPHNSHITPQNLLVCFHHNSKINLILGIILPQLLRQYPTVYHLMYSANLLPNHSTARGPRQEMLLIDQPQTLRNIP